MLRRWLRSQDFPDAALERDFRAEFARKSRDSVSILIAIAATLWIGWAFFDAHLPPGAREKMLFVRLGIIGPILLLLFWGSRTRLFLSHSQNFTVATFAAMAVGFVAVAEYYDMDHVSMAVFGEPTGIDENVISYIQAVVWLFIAFSCIGLLNSFFATGVALSLVFIAINIYLYLHFSVSLPVLVIGSLMGSVNVATSLLTAHQTEHKARETYLAHREARIERERSEGLLLNILPAQIADRLKSQKATIADGFDNVSVLFADIAGFTPLSSRTSPAQIVDMLNRIFVEFDHIARTHGAEKIKTIGDAYMLAAGVPEHREDHRRVVAECALDMVEAVNRYANPLGLPLQMRIGIHSGPAIAGVIGAHKFAYDLWGDTVNVASRMESSGTPGRIQVTAEIYRALQHDYVFEARGPVEVKGKGVLETWWLVGRK
jgi:class 3 adenylate cyclase